MAHTKTKSPISRKQFREHAQLVTFQIGGVQYEMDPREFATGSLGWTHNGKIPVMIDGVRCLCQLGLNLTVVGSKELPPDPDAA